MKRMLILLLLCLALLMPGCIAWMSETVTGASAKATPVCPNDPDDTYKVNGQEFIKVGYWTWKDVHRNTHREPVYVLRPVGEGGAK
ncbi:MAG TPA: hypothetical protein VMW24_16285 [Sedimentisphaerales bacterium]|nr:hypothetical protein [Sedimentisphaerales bacterium]HUX03151.1 hypothetical protein [Phycisphaerae bacterium]